MKYAHLKYWSSLWLAVGLLAAVLLLAGCQRGAQTQPGGSQSGPSGSEAPTQEPDPTYHPIHVTYDPLLVSPLVQQYLAPDQALYRLIFDAVDHFQSQVNVTGLEVTEDALSRVSQAVLDRGEFVYLAGMALMESGDSVELYYRPDYTEERAMADKAAFRARVIGLLDLVNATDCTQTEAVLLLYSELAQHTTYNPQGADVGSFGLLVNGEGICTGYAYALRYLLDQLGIENVLAFSNDESHVWNIVKLGSHHYHLDATWENSQSARAPTLVYFGQDDVSRRDFTGFDGWYTRINSLQEKNSTPVCDSDYFAPLRDAPRAEGAYATHQIHYEDYDGVQHTLDLFRIP